MKIEFLEPSKMLYIRVLGPYGQGSREATEELYRCIAAEGIEAGTLVHCCLDDPTVVTAEQCRTDVGVMVSSDVEPSGKLKVRDFPGGKYVVARKNISDHSDYGKYWCLFLEVMFQSVYEMDERPICELYHSWDEKTHSADVSFCLAVK